jgi:hypothetical protein
MTGQFPKVKFTAEQVAENLKGEGREVDNSLRKFDEWRHPLRSLAIKRVR